MRGYAKTTKIENPQAGNSIQGSTKVVSTYEYHIVINDAQRRLIMRALTSALANDPHSTEALRPMPYEWMQLIRLFGRVHIHHGSDEQISGVNEQKVQP
jgi:hypothetical protein